jgi:hypothetical protein
LIAPASLADKAGLRGTTVRASYLIDRFRVAYEFGGGWTCGCREFASQDSCKHTREADGRRCAQLQIAGYLEQRSAETEGSVLERRNGGPIDRTSRALRRSA